MGILFLTKEQLKRQLIHTRLIMALVMVVFIRELVITEMTKAAGEVAAAAPGTFTGISFAEPFVCLGNSWVVSLLLPLFFLTVIAGLPSAQNYDLFVHIRTTKRRWLLSQILTVTVLSAVTVILVLVLSALLLGKNIRFDFSYSLALTRYGYYFPEKKGEMVLTLLPPNLYHQFSLGAAFFHTALLMFLEYLLLGFFMIFFGVLGHRLLGVAFLAVLTAVSSLLAARESKMMWLFPVAHSTLGLHKEVLVQKERFPMLYSYGYYLAVCAVLLALIGFSMRKKDMMC